MMQNSEKILSLGVNDYLTTYDDRLRVYIEEKINTLSQINNASIIMFMYYVAIGKFDKELKLAEKALRAKKIVELSLRNDYFTYEKYLKVVNIINELPDF
jgi:hypothetical protein